MDLGLIQDRRAGTAPALHTPPAPAGRSLQLHRLRTPSQVATVLHLRDEIDLSVHAAAGSQFLHLEKKETSWASSSGSSWTAS